jgi:hypothetical protein
MISAIRSLAVVLAFSAAAKATVVIDLSGTGTATLTGGMGDSILDATSAPTTVGTGSIDSFERLQNSPTEQGYNTDANNVDDNKGGIFTHSLLLSNLDTTSKLGYYTFLLDINETAKTSLISIDALQLYVASTGNLSQSGTPGPGATLVYDFLTATSVSCTTVGSSSCSGTGSPSKVILDYNNNEGSGNGFDMFLYVKQSLFSGVVPANTPYLYLYSAFGNTDSSDAGFEEWAHITATGQQVPEPVTSALVGGGLIALFFVRRRVRS